MATETQHIGLTADERAEIRSIVLDTRKLIEDDLYRQLERYGVYKDERVNIEQLRHLNSYDIEIRRTIDAALDQELEATDGDYQRSLKNYVREATKTYLNRLVALKTIEVRGLVTEVMVERPEFGNRSEMLRSVDEIAGELTDMQDGGLGVVLDLAYAELTDEIGVIFEENEYTAIDLDFTVLEEIIGQLNGISDSIWKSDEVMGWVYQYFGEQEREEIDERIKEESYRVQDTDVATKTQLFTPRYIVEWMVDNSLGRLWFEMQNGKTEIHNNGNCHYLSPLEDSIIDRNKKSVRNIKILDPACGSGHMLLYAFDVLYEMYLEEGEVAEKYIPQKILKNNLYGIDIDPGAAQLAALTLYLKAKNKEPDVSVEQINIVSADAVLVNGEKKQEVLSRTDTEFERKVLEQVWTSFEHIREWGSLVQIEEEIEKIIEDERDNIVENKSQNQARFTNDGKMATQSSFVTAHGEESWEQVKTRLLSKISKLAEQGFKRNNPVEELFAGEVEKSVQLLDVFVGEYDVVVSNPPYLGSRKMNPELREYIKNNYISGSDLYSAFIERCESLTKDNSYFSTLTMETFMFLPSYTELREFLLNKVNIAEAAHIEHRDEGYMNICFSMRASKDVNNKSRFNYIINSENKKKSLTELYNKYSHGENDRREYVINQKSFAEIENSTFVYWFGDEILTIIENNPNFKSKISSQCGIITGKNSVFLRKIWEVKQEKIGKRYRPIVRSENKTAYTDGLSWLIDWKDNGEYIKDYCDRHGHQCFFGDETKLGDEAVGFIEKSSYLTARKLKQGNFCSMQLYRIYPENHNIDYLTGWLNSSICKFIAQGFNPGVDFNQDDVYRLPYIEPDAHKEEIAKLARVASNRVREKYSLFETTMQFDPDKFIEESQQITNINFQIDMAEADISVISGLIDELVVEEYGLSQKSIDRIYEEVPQNLSNPDHISNIGRLNENNYDFRSHIDSKRLSEDEYSKLVRKVDNISDKDIREISKNLNISPYTVAMIRKENNMYSLDEKRKSAGRLLSYYIGCIFGHWKNSNRINSIQDGILVFDDDFSNNVTDKIRKCINITHNNPYEMEDEISDMLNRDIYTWLQERFFRYYHCKEYRRRGQRIPIYWQLESDEGAFSCFVYYHSIDTKTLSRLRGYYVDKKLDNLQNRLEAIISELDTATDDHARDLRSEKEQIETEINDITEFRNRLDNLIDEGFQVKVEAGIWENIQKVDEYDLLAVPLDKL